MFAAGAEGWWWGLLILPVVVAIGFYRDRRNRRK
ncbi:hypothetical protein JOE58_002513 [Curtobacterium luteum]|uniref:Uncharacterized protein n=1 Tax=Curtobacterium luteum TaxID=33881 RepID=A0ABS2RX83_9MICO|nr:hypothetical protein [Curtobacterium luteum]